MAKADPTDRKRPRWCPPTNGHWLIAVTEWLPGDEPIDFEVDHRDGRAFDTQYWRCRKCGQERNRHDEFAEPCEVDRPPSPIIEGGYTVEDARTRRALTEAMTVRFGSRGPTYAVEGDTGNTYAVDVAAETCSCPDHAKRETFCKHLRRVDLEIRAGTMPGPDGRFRR